MSLHRAFIRPAPSPLVTRGASHPGERAFTGTKLRSLLPVVAFASVVACATSLTACGDGATNDHDAHGDDATAESSDSTSAAALSKATFERDTRLVVTERVALRDAAAFDATPAEWLDVDTVVTVKKSAPTDGFYDVATPAGRVGWANGQRLAFFAPPDYVGLALADPNADFKRQSRDPVWNPDGPWTSDNCAPTSLAMLVEVFGREPDGLTVQESIERVSHAMDRYTNEGSVSAAQVRQAACKLGLEYHYTRHADLDAELASGHMIVLFGYPGDPANPSRVTVYQQPFRDRGYTYRYDGGHAIAVFGKRANGSYVVGDPLSTFGTIELTDAQLADFWARGMGYGTSVWRGQGPPVDPSTCHEI